MILRCPNWLFGVLVLLSAAGATFGANPPGAVSRSAVRIVGCDEIVKSRKRGLCANQLSEPDFRSLAPGVSWFYNWDFQPNSVPPPDLNIEYIPMVWSGDAARLQGLDRYLAAGNKPRAILAINEPNLRGQAFITPQATAEACDRIKAVADRYGIPVVGPNMALGSSKGDSITADDPIQHQLVTYTFIIPFLKATFFYAGKDDFSALAFHGYGNSGELHWATDLMQKEFGKPVWVTEFAEWHAAGDRAEMGYMMQAVDFLERNPNVQGYAWFKERVASNPMISLFESEPGKLTPLGKAYVAMPVHDPDLFYRIPGRLNAARYVEVQNMTIAPSHDGEAFAEMSATKGDDWIEYNIDSEAAVRYTISLRVRGEGAVSIEQRGQTLGRVNVPGRDWQTVEMSASLNAGPQTIRIDFDGRTPRIEWIEFGQ
jgi:hypothetical protein